MLLVRAHPRWSQRPTPPCGRTVPSRQWLRARHRAHLVQVRHEGRQGLEPAPERIHVCRWLANRCRGGQVHGASRAMARANKGVHTPLLAAPCFYPSSGGIHLPHGPHIAICERAPVRRPSAGPRCHGAGRWVPARRRGRPGVGVVRTPEAGRRTRGSSPAGARRSAHRPRSRLPGPGPVESGPHGSSCRGGAPGWSGRRGRRDAGSAGSRGARTPANGTAVEHAVREVLADVPVSTRRDLQGCQLGGDVDGAGVEGQRRQAVLHSGLRRHREVAMPGLVDRTGECHVEAQSTIW